MSGWRFTVCAAEKVEPGDKKGYTEIIRRVVAQRERDQLQKVTGENPALGIGTSPSAASPADLPPPVMSLRQLDPKTSAVSRGGRKGRFGCAWSIHKE